MKDFNKWAIISVAMSILIATGFALSFEAYSGAVAALLFLLVIPIALTFQIRFYFFGIVALVVTAVAFPVEFRGPSAAMMSSSFPLAAVVCGIWLLEAFVIHRRVVLESARVVYAVLIFSGIILASFLVGQFPWFPSEGAPLPAQLAEVGLFLLSGCLFLSVGHKLKNLGQLKWLTWMFLAAGTVTCILQTFPALNFVAKWTTRPGSVGSVFWTWFVALAFSQALFNRSLAPLSRLFLFGVTALTFYHGLFQVRSWASGWAPPLVAFGIILLFRLPRLSLGLGVLAIPTGLILFQQFSEFFVRDEEYSLMTREEAWRVMWQLIEKSPLFGLGPANYYYYTENFPILGWYVRFISHNNYEDLLAQTGFLGLLAFCWFAFEISWLGWRLYQRVPIGFARAYVIGAIGGLAGSLASGMLGDWIIPFYYNAGILGFRSSLLFWVFLGALLALKRMISSPAETPVSKDRQMHAIPLAVTNPWTSPGPA